MKKLLILPVLLAIAVLSVGLAGYNLNTETAFFWPDTAFKNEAVVGVWLSVVAVASVMVVSGGHVKRLFVWVTENRATRTPSIAKTNHKLSRDAGGRRSHQTFVAASGGHLSQMAGRFQQLIAGAEGGQGRLQLARSNAHA